ncbi:unnamed protein product [Diabrotica balteata]|uniref:Uncharacterized protein n=1 Tax=Diabrotica balteata TaxID=107213 RepID=A0A9N9X4E7_DIABA|nr:unnamed protein product [Diabrotica balteata]
MKYMYMSRNNQSRDRTIDGSIDDFNFELVRELKYIRTTVTEDNNGSQEINYMIQAGNRCLFALQNLIKSKQLTRHTKIHVYKTIIRPVVMYVSETWTIRETMY